MQTKGSSLVERKCRTPTQLPRHFLIHFKLWAESRATSFPPTLYLSSFWFHAEQTQMQPWVFPEVPKTDSAHYVPDTLYSWAHFFANPHELSSTVPVLFFLTYPLLECFSQQSPQTPPGFLRFLRRLQSQTYFHSHIKVLYGLNCLYSHWWYKGNRA